MRSKEIWEYIPDTNELYQISSAGRIRRARLKGSIINRLNKTWVNPNGYVGSRISINGKQRNVNIHSVMAQAFLNHIPNGHELVVDHIDGDRLNNNISNLRLVSNRENTSRGVGSSKYIGVYWNKRANKWKSQIMINGKNIFLGYFKDEEEAANAYQNKLSDIEPRTIQRI